MRIGIAGAGVMGRMLTLELLKRGHEITLYDRDDFDASRSCSFIGAGMLAPYGEYNPAYHELGILGHEALDSWKQWIGRFTTKLQYDRTGTIMVAAPDEEHELDKVANRLTEWDKGRDAFKKIERAELLEFEPGLAEGFEHGLFFPEEGHICNRDLLPALASALSANIHWKRKTTIERIEPGRMHSGSRHDQFDLCIDCRGFGASNELTELRGVRGELVYLHAPDVILHRPIRVAHPDYPLYIVPRENGEYVIGATQVETEDESGISLNGMLELLSAAHSIHPGFASATVTQTHARCRPAFPDLLPRIMVDDGLIRVNGLYRQGFLLAPLLAETAADLAEGKTPSNGLNIIIHEDSH